MNYPFITKNINTDLAVLNICELFNDFIPINSIHAHANIIYSWPDNIPYSYRVYQNFECTGITVNVSIKVI